MDAFTKLYRGLKSESNILDDGEGNSLRYDLKTSAGYVNIIVSENYSKYRIEFSIFKVVGQPLTPETEDHAKNKEFGFYVSELEEESLAKVVILKNGNTTIQGDEEVANQVLELISDL